MATTSSTAAFSIFSSSSSSSSSSTSFLCHIPRAIHSQFFDRHKPRCLPMAIRATISTAPIPSPPSPPSSTGIVLVDKSDSDKVNRLKLNYIEKIVPILKDEFSYKNIHEVPKIEKIVVNCGIGDAEQNSKALEAAIRDISLITGQKPVKTKAKKAIARFKVREGDTVGIAVTLRKKVMYSFLDRLINLGLPRTRDFQGVSSNSFDGHGNYSMGMSDLSVFPEIKYDALGKNQGCDICIATSAKSDNEAHRLLALLGLPFKEGGGPTVLARKKRKKKNAR